MGCLQAFVQRLKVALDKITSARARVVNATKSPWWAKARFLTHVVGPLVASIVIAATFYKTHKLTLFSLHPICMSLAFVVLMPEGVVAYRNHLLLDSFGPIMQHGTKHKNRTIHMTLLVLASIFAALGVVFVVCNKISSEKSLLPHTVHAVIGIVVLLAMILQVSVGRLKHISLMTGVIDARNRGKKFRWHGKMGLLVYDMATIAFVSGIVAFFGFSLVTAFVPLLVAYAWLNVNLQMHESKHITVPVYASDGGELQDGDTTPETQQLTQEGVPETKGEREYPV